MDLAWTYQLAICTHSHDARSIVQIPVSGTPAQHTYLSEGRNVHTCFYAATASLAVALARNWGSCLPRLYPPLLGMLCTGMGNGDDAGYGYRSMFEAEVDSVHYALANLK